MTMTEAVAPASTRALEHLPDSELLALFRAGPKGSRQRAAVCDILVRRYEGLVRGCVMRYRHSPEPAEVLMQVGYVGLLKAINYYDPAIGESLPAYAAPCVSGEIKRHFRDQRWQVRVRRRAQEHRLELRQASEELAQEVGREPSDDELAARLGITAEELMEARQADAAFSCHSLNVLLSDGEESAELGDLLGNEDARIEHVINMQALSAHWPELPERQQRILVMRFYGDLSQAEISTRLGISQMHVSRLLARSLGHLRSRLLGPASGYGEPAAATPLAGRRRSASTAARRRRRESATTASSLSRGVA
jgi:RNA polymerase sigma-B factor